MRNSLVDYNTNQPPNLLNNKGRFDSLQEMSAENVPKALNLPLCVPYININVTFDKVKTFLELKYKNKKNGIEVDHNYESLFGNAGYMINQQHMDTGLIRNSSNGDKKDRFNNLKETQHSSEEKTEVKRAKSNNIFKRKKMVTTGIGTNNLKLTTSDASPDSVDKTNKTPTNKDKTYNNLNKKNKTNTNTNNNNSNININNLKVIKNKVQKDIKDTKETKTSKKDSNKSITTKATTNKNIKNVKNIINGKNNNDRNLEENGKTSSIINNKCSDKWEDNENNDSIEECLEIEEVNKNNQKRSPAKQM